jgi:hypothetical protein
MDIGAPAQGVTIFKIKNGGTSRQKVQVTQENNTNMGIFQQALQNLHRICKIYIGFGIVNRARGFGSCGHVRIYVEDLVT